jgi:hypothetical protein
MIAAACGGAWALRGRNGRNLDTSVVSINPSVDVQLCTKSTESKQALSDTAAMLTVGSASACLLSVGSLFATEFFQRHPQSPSPEFLAMSTAISLAATWLVLLTGQLSRKVTWLQKNPRKTFLAVGLLLGALSYGLDQYLLLDYSSPAGYSPAFRSIGVHRLVEANMNPSWLGYSVFFGGILFWHRWWQDMSAKRSHQISFGRLLTAGFAAWLFTTFFAFPQWPAILWTVTISAAVQLATPLAPRRVA